MDNLLLADATDIREIATALRKLHLESLLLPILIQLGVILMTARVAAWVARMLKQPNAVGEIAAGLLLGPSFFQRVWPAGYAAIFQPSIVDAPPELQPLCDVVLHWIFTMLSQIGLIFLLFIIGLEFDFSHLKSKGRAASLISLSGIVFPFCLGLGLAYLIHPYVNASQNDIDFVGFGLFMGTAMSITALPILGRIMMEMGITHTKLGVITISAAAIDDVMGWMILAAVAAIVRGHFSMMNVGYMVLAAIVFAVGLLFLAGPALRAWARKSVDNPQRTLSAFNFASLLVLMFACSIATNVIGIFAIFGAFLLGATFSSEKHFREAVNQKLHDFVMVFFLPIFFTYTGLRTRVDALDTPLMWLICSAVIGVAVLGKFGGCGLAAKLSGFSTRESICIGTMMNTRALMELVVINIGFQLGVIPESVFAMLVLMALITTVMTTPILIAAMRGTEIEPYVLKSGFIQTPPMVSSS
jgi:Kef-type K+ transport system membrane component KefB